MLWAILIVLYVVTVIVVVRKHTRESVPRVLSLDFGDNPELVEPTLRALARDVERYGIYDLSIYLESRDEEAHHIAMRLSEHIPLQLHRGPLPCTNPVRVDTLPENELEEALRKRLNVDSS